MEYNDYSVYSSIILPLICRRRSLMDYHSLRSAIHHKLLLHSLHSFQSGLCGVPQKQSWWILLGIWRLQNYYHSLYISVKLVYISVELLITCWWRYVSKLSVGHVIFYMPPVLFSITMWAVQQTDILLVRLLLFFECLIFFPLKFHFGLSRDI